MTQNNRRSNRRGSRRLSKGREDGLRDWQRGQEGEKSLKGRGVSVWIPVVQCTAV